MSDLVGYPEDRFSHDTAHSATVSPFFSLMMEFILQDSYHEEHDSTWTVYSQHYSSSVCLGCIVEILEDSDRLCLQKKPAISELLRLLTYQSGDLLQLFQQEEHVVWHLAEILLGKKHETFCFITSTKRKNDVIHN